MVASDKLNAWDFIDYYSSFAFGWCSTCSAQTFVDENPSIQPVQSNHSL
jgi:hypothetical protein